MIRLLALPFLACFLLGCHPNYTIVEHSAIAISCGEQPTLVLEMVNGPITITTAKCKDITGQLTKRGVGPDKEEAEKELKNITFDSRIVDGKYVFKGVRTDGGKSWNSSGTEATLQIPVGSKLELVTSNGTIQVTGKNQGTVAKTSNGSVILTGGSAPVDILTANGPVRCIDAQGLTKIETSNGAITIRGTNLDLNCKSSNGSIDCTGDLAPGNHKLITTNGYVKVSLPRDTCLNIEAGTSNGKVNSDFSINKTEGSKKNNYIKGTIGSGDSTKTLTIKTSNSSIGIRQEKARESTPVTVE